MDTTISKNYKRVVYLCYLPLALLPFAWVLGRELALNMIITSPHTDFSLHLPFNLSHSFYLAAMTLFCGLGATTIKVFLDNPPKVNLLYKSGYGLIALTGLVLNAEFMITSFTLAEMMIYFVLPITITLHLISLRRVEVFDSILVNNENNLEYEAFKTDPTLTGHLTEPDNENTDEVASLKLNMPLLVKPHFLNKKTFLRQNTVTISEYFEMELGESLKPNYKLTNR